MPWYTQKRNFQPVLGASLELLINFGIYIYIYIKSLKGQPVLTWA